MATQKTLDWLLAFVTTHPGCQAADVPPKYRQFLALEDAGKIQYRDGWRLVVPPAPIDPKAVADAGGFPAHGSDSDE